MNLRSACIAQLIQFELLRRRFGLTQIQGGSLPNSRFFRLFRYMHEDQLNCLIQ